jgi:hypothetical protein
VQQTNFLSRLKNKRMKKLFLSALLLCFCNLIFSQMLNYQWSKAVGSALTEDMKSVVADASGNTYVMGHYTGGTIDIDPGPGTYTLANNGNRDIFVAKYNSVGNFVWGFGIGSTGNEQGYDIELYNNNIYITGSYVGTVDVDPSISTTTLATLSNSVECFFAKYDLNGNFQLAKSMTSSNATSRSVGTSIGLDNNGNIFITGLYSGTVDFDPSPSPANLTTGIYAMFFSKYTSAGNFVFVKSSQNGDICSPASLEIDNANNILITGTFGNASGQVIDFDPGPSLFNLTCTTNGDMFVAKYDNSGNFTWAFKVGTSVGLSITQGLSVEADASGNVFVTGNYQNTTDFDPSAGTATLTVPSPPNTNIFVAKYSSAGAYLWAYGMGDTGPDSGQQLAVDNNGGVFVSGFFSSTVDFDPGIPSYTLASAGSSDFFIARFGASGTFSTAVGIGGTGADQAYGITLNSTSNELFVVGYFNSTVDFDPSPGTSIITSNGGQDGFLEKFQFCLNAPLVPGSIAGATIMCSGAGSSNYSVAIVVGATSYSWALPAGWSGASLTNTISATPGSTGIFTVTASNACGTSPQQTLNVTIDPNPTVSVAGGAICPGGSFTLNPSGANTYTYSGGQIVSPTVTTSYTVTGTSTAGCISADAVVTITVANNLTVTISGNGTVCSGSALNLVAGGAATYTWNTGAMTNTIAPSPTTNVTYSVIGASGSCSNTAVVNITVNTLPSISAASSTNQLCIGSSATLTGMGGNTYTWNPGGSGASIIISPTVNTTYTVTGTDGNGCENVSVITQTVINCSTGLSNRSISQAGLKIYPNPSSGILNIEFETLNGPLPIRLYDVMGKLVLENEISNHHFSIDIRHLSIGVYFAKIDAVNFKIIKE